MNSTTSGMGNTTTPRPSADAWCVYELDENRSPIILDSCGVSSVTHPVTGVVRVAFTNPERFQSGAYVGLVQPELGNSPGGYGMGYVQGSTTNANILTAGQSGSCDIISLGFSAGTTKSSPFRLNDSANGDKVRYNAAFFCLRSDSDIYKSSVANWITWSEKPSLWQPQAAQSWVENASKAPDGTQTAFGLVEDGTTNQRYLLHYTSGSYRSASLAGKVWTYSVYAKAGARNFIRLLDNSYQGTSILVVNLATGATTGSSFTTNYQAHSVTNADNGWWRISLSTGATTSTGFITPYFNPQTTTSTSTYAGDGNVGIYLWGGQMEEGSVLSRYIPTTTTSPVYGDQTQLLNHSPGAGGSGVGSRQNLLLYSQDFTQAQWTKTYAGTARVGISAGGFTAPDGTTTAMKLHELDPIPGVVNYKSLSYTVASATADQSWMFSVHAKAAERKYLAFADSSTGIFGRCVVDLETGAVTENSNSKNIVVDSVGDGWQRIIICGTSPKDRGGSNARFGFSPNPGPTVGMSGEGVGAYGPSYHGVSGSGILIWGAQLERGMVYSPYTPTTSAAVGTVSARVAGLTYQSPPTQLRDAREATAWGTIVIPAKTGAAGEVVAYLEGAWGCSTVVGRINSAFDVYFTTPMDSPTYCVITSTEQESVIETEAAVNQTNSIPPTDEFTLNTIQNNQGAADTQRTRQSFTVSCRRQAPSTDSGATVNGFTEQAVHFQRGRTQRIHFMVFGGRQIRGTS